MDTLVVALGPAFVVALAVQQVAEGVRSLFKWRGAESEQHKAKIQLFVLLAGLIVGLGAALLFAEIRVLVALRPDANPNWVLDVVVTALVVSGGTEGLNSLLKFLGHTKEKKEEETEKLAAESQLMRIRAQLEQEAGTGADPVTVVADDSGPQVSR